MAKYLSLMAVFCIATALTHGCRTTPTVPDLILQLQHEDRSRQAAAARRLGELGVSAAQAIPALIAATPQLDEAVSTLCRLALADREVFLEGFSRYLREARPAEQSADMMFKALSSVQKMAARCKTRALELLPELHRRAREAMARQAQAPVQAP